MRLITMFMGGAAMLALYFARDSLPGNYVLAIALCWALIIGNEIVIAVQTMDRNMRSSLREVERAIRLK